MRKKIVLLFMLIAIAMGGYAQQAPNKTNTIVITQADSNNLRDKLLRFLSSEDYTLSVGRTATVVITEPKTLPNGTRLYFNFRIKGPDIILTGFLPAAGQPTTRISYQAGKSGTPMMKGWLEMIRLARALGGKIKFETQ